MPQPHSKQGAHGECRPLPATWPCDRQRLRGEYGLVRFVSTDRPALPPVPPPRGAVRSDLWQIRYLTPDHPFSSLLLISSHYCRVNRIECYQPKNSTICSVSSLARSLLARSLLASAYPCQRLPLPTSPRPEVAV